MDVHFVEVTNGPNNWGKVMVARFTDEEWSRKSEITGRPLLRECGWGRDHTLVVDLQTGEGAFFPDWVHASDLAKHQIWVCVLFERALCSILDGAHNPMQTPAVLDFPDIPLAFQGYRRGGPRQQQLEDAARAVSEAWNRYIGVGDVEGDDDVQSVADAVGLLREVLGDPPA